MTQEADGHADGEGKEQQAAFTDAVMVDEEKSN